MKNTWKSTLMLTAAVLTLGAAAAYGQEPMTANVPFAFHTAAGIQPAGQYNLNSISDTSAVFTLRNQATGKGTMLGIALPAGQSANPRPRLEFVCSDNNGCALSAVWGLDGRGWKYNRPNHKPSEYEHVAVVYFER